MGEQNRASSQQLIASSGASVYLLELNSITPGVSGSIPLHLILSEVEERSGQYIVPISHSKPSEIGTQQTNSPKTVTTIDCKYSQEATEVARKSGKQINVLSNETDNLESLISAPETSHVEVKQKPLNYFKRHGTKHKQEQKVIRHNEEPYKIQNYMHIADRVAPPRALAVLPPALRVRRGCIYPVRPLPPRVRFGPVQGVSYKIFPAEADELIFESAVAEKPIFLLKRDEESVTQINVSDKERSNWLSLLPLGKDDTANVWLYEEEGEIYGVTTILIPSRTPLSLGYSKKYAEEHKLPPEQPMLDLEKALAEQPKWWCFECRRALGSSSQLLRHKNVHHKEEKHYRSRYRCSYCLRTFGRLFTLRRHISQICTNRQEKSSPSVPEIEPTIQDPDFCIPTSTEDNRIPSDESFQNYTSALDFSTSLFDTDRISNLDMCGSSKSEAEFNPYSTELKFDNLYNNEDYSKFCTELKFGNGDKTTTKNQEVTNVTCPHCQQTMTKAKKRRHLKECPARRLECECGKVFTRKDDFANHVHLNHNTGLLDTVTQTKQDSKKTIYKCEDCKLKFKRRGMLVNHLWRVHNATSVEVPLERRVRHYPCAVCPKIYRTAAKRDRHVTVHHPGACIRAAPIEGERRVYQPAKCSACPREYVTRSKLLQHIRAQHPELAASNQIKNKPPLEASPKHELSTRPEPTLGFY